MRLRNLLVERYINLFGKEEISKYIDEIWDILQRTYKPFGGFKTASSKEELLDKTDLAKLVRKDNKIVAVALYRDQRGRKSIAKGSDGSLIGKESVKKIYQEDIKMNRSWGEFSEKAELFLLRIGGIPIPNTLAAELTNKEILSKDPNGFHYTRLIQGKPIKKILIGQPQ